LHIANKIISRIAILFLIIVCPLSVGAQEPPSPEEIAEYTGILAAAARGDAMQIRALIMKGENPNVRDNYERTPLHVATYMGHHEAMRELVAAGANPNALEHDRYDIPHPKNRVIVGCKRKKHHQPL
jgi:ankyrin repeat protein